MLIGGGSRSRGAGRRRRATSSGRFICVSSTPELARAAGQAVAEAILVAALARESRSRPAASRFSASILLALGQLGQSGPEERAPLLDLRLEVDEGAEDLLGPRRAAGDVDVDRDEAVDALHHGVGVEDPAGARRTPPC